MSGSKSKNKGNAFERELATFLSNLYNDSFVRASHSGAYVGGLNSIRKQHLSENQIKAFKGDIIPPDTWTKFNAEAKSYADFPFHLMLSGDCKQLDSWLEQLLDASDEGDCNVLFMKFNRIGRYIAVEPKLSWVIDNFTFYASTKYGDWVITEFDSFFKNNAELLKTYSGSSDTTSTQEIPSNIITLAT
jgi:hypothetical protein